MGRYAFFSSGLEYKFVFAVQGSQDILRFGGWFNGSEEDPAVKWSATDKVRLLDTLQHMETLLDLSACEFTEYAADLDGTYTLKCALSAQAVSDGEVYARYILGCLIYHQLLYTPVLEVRFEF